ncbi:MAG TPA: hypothetical protein PLR99_32435, partial [Polyangiaceae bacterium]|nr:hypothetical protein [Polyangiaceae bacterium]
MSTSATPTVGARRGVATQVLVAFLLTTLAFAVTVAFSVYALRRAAQDNEELAKGFVPVALRLGQLRATQATLATLVDGVPGERDPQSTKLLLQTLTSVRTATLLETRAAMERLGASGTNDTRVLARALAQDVDSVEATIVGDRRALEELFAAIERGDTNGANRAIVVIGAQEHDADKKLGALANRVAGSMEVVGERARTRERRSIAMMIALAALA